jgi:single stranded DNA-binding protein
MNFCHFKGCLVTDIELKKTKNEKSVINFSIAVKSFVKDQNPETHYFDFEAWGPVADFLAEGAYKGRHIIITAQAKNHKWETKDGEVKKAIRFRVNSFEWVSYDESKLKNKRKETQDDNQDEEEIPFEVPSGTY